MLVLVGFIYWSTAGSLSRQIDATIDAEITGLAEQFNQRGVLGLIRAIDRRADAARETGGLYLLTDSNFAPLAGNLTSWPEVEPGPNGEFDVPASVPDGDYNWVLYGMSAVPETGQVTIQDGTEATIGGGPLSGTDPIEPRIGDTESDGDVDVTDLLRVHFRLPSACSFGRCFPTPM